MRQIATGKGLMPLASLIAIWSISLVVDLPGLAISPLLGQLDKVFPHASEFEIQLLSALPNICIFPFILLSGRLSVSRSKLLLVKLGLVLFLIGGAMCFVVDNIDWLIVASCLVGIGCGLVIPLAAGLLAEAFSGPALTRQLGIKSGIANATLIFSTFVVGALGKQDWHMPFVVYLLPVVPLVLSCWLPKDAAPAASPTPKSVAPDDATVSAVTTDETDERVGADAAPAVAPDAGSRAFKHFEQSERADDEAAARSLLPKNRVRAMWSIVLFYFAITFCAVALSMYTPFLMQHLGMSETEVGIVGSVFYLFITLPGFFLPLAVRTFGRLTSQWSILFMGIGSLLFVVAQSYLLFLLASALLGFGYGILQPTFYTKTARLAPTARMSSLFLSYVLAANYLGTAVTPFGFGWLKALFHTTSNTFPFLASAVLMALLLVISIILPNRYAFRMQGEV